ncbi:MAG: HAD family hydrolase [Chloroflexota bacterium]
MLKAVLFDLDDTLLDWSGFNHDWPALERQHLRLLFDYVGAEIQPIENFDAFCAEFGTRMADAWVLARSTMRAPNLGTVLVETTVAFGVPADALDTRRCLEAYQWEAIPGTKLFPEVPQTLTLLRQHGLKIGIVTNAHQPMWIRDVEITAHGLFDFFPDCRISAADVGYLKPHPMIFQAALRCTGTKPEETVFVGDDPNADIVGAQAAGLKAVMRRLPHRPFASETIIPDAFISRLDELPLQLDTWYPGWRD